MFPEILLTFMADAEKRNLFIQLKLMMSIKVGIFRKILSIAGKMK